MGGQRNSVFTIIAIGIAVIVSVTAIRGGVGAIAACPCICRFVSRPTWCAVERLHKGKERVRIERRR